MTRARRAGMALALIAAGAVEARAGTVVLEPDDVAVPTQVREAVRVSLRTATADLAGVRIELADPASRSSCAGDVECLAEVGRALDAQRVLGCTVAPVDGVIAMECWLVDVGSGEVLGDGSRTFSAAEADSVPGDLVATLIILAPPEEPVDEVSAPPDAAAAPVPAAPALRATGTPLPWSLDVHTGAVVPRGDLAVGPVVGLSAARRLAAVSGLRVAAGVDWMVLAQQDQAFTSPPDYPRARAELIQEAHVVSTWAGATIDLVELGPVWLYGGASVGIAINRSRFEAFNMARVERGVAPLVAARAGVRSARGRLLLGLDLAWRETHHDLGDSGDFGEATTSGLLVTLALGFRR